LALDAHRYAFAVTCEKGRQQAERWTWTPEEADAGKYDWRLTVCDASNQVIARGRTIIQVAAPMAGQSRRWSLLIIGDSLTHAGVYPAQVLELCRQRPQGLAVTLVGGHGKDGIVHEGYGGWSAERFATRCTGIGRVSDHTLRDSPFIYAQPEGPPKVDFDRYCDEFLGSQAPDVTMIFLGGNDIFFANDQNIDSFIDTMFKSLEVLFDMIRRKSGRTRIGLVLTLPPAASQDGFGASYGCLQTRWQYKRNQHRLVERMLEQYAPHRPSSPHLVPACVHLDTVHGYPVVEESANARDERIVHRISNGAHPSQSGYSQIADAIYAWLVNIEQDWNGSLVEK
jgi:lysophospholipase L1-like esterase